jgi:acyl-CoA-binding protein
MDDLDKQFQEAQALSKQLSQRPDDQTLLKIYALFKQASVGDVLGERPGFFDFVGGAKYDAWAEQRGKDQAQAKQEYVDLINGLKSRQA